MLSVPEVSSATSENSSMQSDIVTVSILILDYIFVKFIFCIA